MCEANAYVVRDDKEQLILKAVDVLEPKSDGEYLLVDIFGSQKTIRARLKRMNLVDHKIIFEE
jgi:predicted RNA-binding protein